MTLSKKFTLAANFGLSAEQTTVKVVSAYLQEVFNLKVTVEDLSTIKYLPSICNYGGFAGIKFKDDFYPLVNFDNLTNATGETQDKKSYPVLKWSLPEDLSAEYGMELEIIPCAIRPLPARTLSASIKTGSDAEKAATAFYPGAPDKNTPDGVYSIVEYVPVGDYVRVTTESFSFVASPEKVAQTDSITIKDGDPYNGETKLGGSGVEAKNIPTEKGFKMAFNKFEKVGTSGAAVIYNKDGECYWAPASVKQIADAIKPTELASFVIEVTGIRTKDSKEYPICTVTTK